MDKVYGNRIYKFMIRYKITVEYDGTNYVGWQKQSDQPNRSIEEILEKAIFELSQTRVKIIGSGRTDAGVHAIAQVAHFDLEKNFEEFKITLALNHYLKSSDIAILSCKKIDKNFHSRFDAKMSHYHYLISNRAAPPKLLKNRIWHIPVKLEIDEMRKAASYLIGKHNFSAFRDKECQAKSPIKTIDNITITKNNDEILIAISAESFLHHMIRNIAGTLMWAGSGKIKAEAIKEILESCDRTKSGPNAPACGLYFAGVDYHTKHIS
jgi:tRNA pseudouridine38-40 synthase